VHKVSATGDPVTLGQAHGQQAASQIQSLLTRWRDLAASQETDLDAVIRTLSHECGFRETTHTWLPDLVAEVDGLAAGASITADEAFALNCMDEARWLSSTGGCSVVAITDSGTDASPEAPVIGQNMDLDTWMDGAQVALQLQPDGTPGQVLLTRAGMVGLCGANDAGLAVMVNTLDQLPTDRNAVPVAFVVRALLAQTSLDAAVDLLHQLPHASGQAYTIASADGVRGFECGAGVVQEYRNDDALPGRRWHTNHPISAADQDIDLTQDDAGWATGSTGPRMAHLDAKAAAISSRADLQRLLSDSTSGICMFPGRWRDDGFTFASIVVTLTKTGAAPEVLMAPGPPDRTDYEPVAFNSI
jgi:isopenicillin-N N-acyltransferase like protein